MRMAAMLRRETGWAIRRLLRAPGFTLVAVLTVGLAVAPSLLFRLVDRAVLPPMPFEHSDELLAVWQRMPWGKLATSYPKLRHLQQHSRTSEVAIFKGRDLFTETADGRVQVHVEAVTPNFFDVLRARPLLGRVFREDENETPLAHPVVILSERVWRERYGARPEMLTEKIVLSGVPFTVVGVMPADFGGLAAAQWRWAGVQSADAWIPAMMAPLGMFKEWASAITVEHPHATLWCGIARLRPGHSVLEARAEAEILGRDVEALWPSGAAGSPVPFDVIPLSEDAVDPRISKAVFLLRIAGILVLGLGAMNLGNMFVARGADRARTLGVQSFLGASRFGLASGMAAEALFVGLLGAALGVVLTQAALVSLRIAEPTILTAPFGVTFDPAGFRVDGTVGVASLAFCLVAAVGAILVPAWQAIRIDSSSVLRGGAGVTGGGLRRLRLTRPGGLLVAAEVAFAVALTLPALLLVRSVGRLVGADLGFTARGVTTGEVRLPTTAYRPQAAASFFDRALDRLRATPGVEAASFVNGVPLSDRFFTSQIKPTTSAADAGFLATVLVVSPEAFRTLGIALREGRDFGRDDQASGARVAILSADGARRLPTPAVGARVDVMTFGGRSVEVIGIAGNVPYQDLAREQLPVIYLPLGQVPLTEGTLVVRTGSAPAEAATLLRNTITSLDPGLRTMAIEPLGRQVDRALGRFRGATWLLGVAAGLALLLAGTGVYGLLSSLVARSVPEIGIRIALGAAPATIGRQLARSSLALAFVGLAFGLVLGSSGARYLEGYLYGVRPYDAASFLIALAAAALLALLAALQPARRASRVDPMIALRAE
jgi:predicted permease